MTLRLSHMIFKSPARMSILGFMVLIVFGNLLLMLPVATPGDGMGFVDALFMSTSASCVTGLTVADTGKDLSLFGQMVILIQIQIGGLGIMTVSTLFLMMMRRRPTLTGHALIKDTFTFGEGRQSAVSVIKSVFLLCFVMEGVGAAAVFLKIWPEFGWSRGLYIAVFHAVSAFCNAGFSLFSDNLTRFQNDGFLNMVFCILIITGGLGFVVITEVKDKILSKNGNHKGLSLHTKIVLSATVILIAAGTLAIFFMEYNNTLALLSPANRLAAAFFQSVTARTAGFNTIAIGDLANETLFLMIILMFIGASPGSCGGGVKTTTITGLVLLGFSRLRGLEKPRIFRRTLTEASVSKAASIVMISVAVVALAFMALLIFELGRLPHTHTRAMFPELLFETVSAFGTVGLSTGITQGLSNTGKLIITLLMFIGRLGPLVIALAVSRKQTGRFQYAEENIMIG